jgi:glycine cleavage system regulatory protein
MAAYVLSVLGTDRAGLVAALSSVVTKHGGNWEQSHMTQLAGKFAGVVLITIPDQRAAGFAEALVPLEQMGLLDISIEATAGNESVPVPTLEFEIVGNDRPGIVHEVSQLLTTLDVSIVDLETFTEAAPMDGGNLFHARASVVLPADIAPGDLVDNLEALANDLMVDLMTTTVDTKSP